MKYTIKAHPTTYAGVRFRSRLEARWAAFFDAISESATNGYRYRWEYEPIDLAGWSPDFLVEFHSPAELVVGWYVEVKPYTSLAEFEDHTAWSMMDGDYAIRPAVCGVSPVVSLFSTEPGKSITALDLSPSWDRLWKQAGNAVQWRAA